MGLAQQAKGVKQKGVFKSFIFFLFIGRVALTFSPWAAFVNSGFNPFYDGLSKALSFDQCPE